MPEVKWIKLSVDMFDHHKIKYLRRLPEGNNIVLVWIMLLTLAGRCNSGGMIFLTENIPYTPKMLADELDFKENTVCLALLQLEQLGMIYTEDDCFVITNWNKHQSLDRNLDMREYNRLAQQRSRGRKKALSSSKTSTDVNDGNTILVNDETDEVSKCQNDGVNDVSMTVNDGVNDKSMTCQPCQTTEERRKKEEEREEESKREEERETDLESQSFILRDEREYIQNLIEESELEGDDAKKYEQELKESLKQKYFTGSLGNGVVFMSNEQFADLCEKLSYDELHKYIEIVAKCERDGKHFKKKSHYTAILEMAIKDRRIIK